MADGYWQEVLRASGFTPLPRWSRSTVRDVAELRAPLPPDVVRTLTGAVLLAAHAKVTAALTGDPDLASGYLPAGAVPDRSPLLVRLPVSRCAWRDLVAAAEEARRAATRHGAAELALARAELGRSAALFDTVVIEPAVAGPTAVPPEVVLTVAVDGTDLVLRHRVDALDHETAARVAGYYRTALDRIARTPERDHSERGLLSPQEVRFQLEQLAGPVRELPDRRFHELFEERVRRHPGAVAAVQGGKRWTYRELNQRANRVGRALQDRGVSPEDVVAVVTERNLAWLAAVIGVFKAGAVYLPIEPHFPARRIASMLRRSGCRQVLTQQGASATLNAAVGAVPAGDASGAGPPAVTLLDEVLVRPGPDADLGLPITAGHGAYVYFTSGSTGEPKGALCEHAGFLNHLLAMVEELGIAEGCVVAQTAPQCFDISLWQLVTALVAGGTTHIVEQEAILDVGRFVDTLRAGRIEIVQLVPSYLEVLLTALDGRPLPHLRYVSATGEPLKRELVERWFAAFPHVPLVNAYGLTEVCDDTNLEIMHRVPERSTVSLGRPLRNVRVYVVDEQLNLVPLGSPGEIVFSGVCVARGYLNDESRTKAAFVEDPHRPGERVYRSGDFGFWAPDGRLEFHGRRDSQVKVRGFRVEIGEIENRLLRIPGVRDAAVVITGGTGVTGSGDEPHLVAFYAGPCRLPPDRVRALLAEDLPDYMIPTLLHHRAVLPLTRNGKIDKRALVAEAAGAGGGAPPESDAERRLAEAWAGVLKLPVERIDRAANFFTIGGTSLTAVRLAIALNRLVSVEEVTRAPVLADLAQLLERRTAAPVTTGAGAL